MSIPSVSPRVFYVTGGTMRPNWPSYIRRPADDDLYESVQRGEYCYVLAPRQLGKSSLMASTARRLRDEGSIRVALVDFTVIGSARGQDPAGFYRGVAYEIHENLKLEFDFDAWWDGLNLPELQRLTEFMGKAAESAPGGAVIFLDEIDAAIGLPFSDDFFGAVRGWYNARATDPHYERITVVLLGVATPMQLIRDPARTPFNIGHAIVLDDFTAEEAKPLAACLPSEQWMQRVLHWTGGHPYLTQAVCRKLADVTAAGSAEEVVDAVVSDMFLSPAALKEEANLKHAGARLAQGKRPLLRLYQRVRRGKPVEDQPASPLYARLKLTGLVKADRGGRLRVRNRIYETVFSPEWVRSHMPRERTRWVAGFAVALLVAGFADWWTARQYVDVFRATREETLALQQYEKLRRVPFWRVTAEELLAQFWERQGDRDRALLQRIHLLQIDDSVRRRKDIAGLLGEDYPHLISTQRFATEATAVALSSDGTMLARAGAGVQVLDTRSFQARGPVLRTDSPSLLVFSTDKKSLFTLTEGRRPNAQAWNISTGESEIAPSDVFDRFANGSPTLVEKLPLEGNMKDALGIGPLLFAPNVLAVAFSANGGRVAATRDDGTTVVVRAGSGDPIGPFVRVGVIRFESAAAVGFERDSGEVLTVGSRTLRRWRMDSDPPPQAVLNNGDQVSTAAFGPDGTVVVIGGRRVEMQVRRRDTGELAGPVLSDVLTDRVYAVSPDGKVMFVGSHDRLLLIATGQETGPKIEGTPFYALSAAFRPDGRALLLGYTNGSAELVSTETGKRLAFSLNDNHNTDVVVAFSPNGREILTGSRSGFVRLWRGDGPQHPLTVDLPHARAVTAVAFAPDGKSFVVLTDGFAYHYSIEGVLKAARFLPGTPKTVRFSNDCPACIDVLMVVTGDRYYIKRIRLDEADAEPIRGEPKALLAEWERKLALRLQ